MESLYTRLDESLLTCPLATGLTKFLPADKLDRITLEDIRAELPWTRKLFSPRLSQKIASEAKRVFCILVLMEQSAAMEQLINEGITDEDLPLCRNADDKQDSEYNVLASVGGNKRFLSSISWGQGHHVDQFLQKQWMVQSPIFNKAGSHFVLDKDCSLPLTECRTEQARGGMGVVHKAKNTPGPPTSLPEDEPFFAIKEIPDKKVFKKEKKNLDMIQELQNKHLITLLASCERSFGDKGSSERESTYYLLFPWADGGTLRDFWEKQDSKVRTPSLIRWALGQILGLVDGIHALHGRNIRHGDIKPQNILVFGGHQGDNSTTLVLADMGVSKFHEKATDLRESATMTAESTISYEAPEADDTIRKQDPRRRRYDMWSAGCMFLEFTVWLVYNNEAVKGFHEQRTDPGDPMSPGNFFAREPKQSAEIHPAVTAAIKHLREHPVCKVGTALGDLVTLISDRLLRIQPEDRTEAPELLNKVKTIVDTATMKKDYLGHRANPPLPIPEFFHHTGHRKPSTSQTTTSY
ncbi:hypothetical protein CEP52_009962 [Fusarium oligoseptatum]|uniref:Protein kinase domain-containing protein n=1 Tax=Fusarium oligoseptatum TaxID=2604345 RepID=A0A428TAI0_9HYPO|nr:hypothetical protein CEP52_009962 [Fusarium oligoseptatum]